MRIKMSIEMIFEENFTGTVILQLNLCTENEYFYLSENSTRNLKES